MSETNPNERVCEPSPYIVRGSFLSGPLLNYGGAQRILLFSAVSSESSMRVGSSADDRGDHIEMTAVSHASHDKITPAPAVLLGLMRLLYISGTY